MYVQGRDVFVGRPKISGKWLCFTILPTSLVNLLEKHGVDDHTTLACSGKLHTGSWFSRLHHSTSKHSWPRVKWCRTYSPQNTAGSRTRLRRYSPLFLGAHFHPSEREAVPSRLPIVQLTVFSPPTERGSRKNS